jgi:hypothetical protein
MELSGLFVMRQSMYACRRRMRCCCERQTRAAAVRSTAHQQGLVPKGWLASRRPLRAAWRCAAALLNRPRSPLPLS